MFFKYSLLLLAGSLLWQPAQAEVVLSASPSNCVTLQQGRECHAQIQASWNTPQPVTVCLYLDEQQLQCWRNLTSAQWQWHFTDVQSRQLILWQMTPSEQKQHVLATTKIEVSWVQSAHKKRLWRRF